MTHKIENGLWKKKSIRTLVGGGGLSHSHKCISFVFAKVAVNVFSDLHEVLGRVKRCLAGTFDVLKILLGSRSMSSLDGWGWS